MPIKINLNDTVYGTLTEEGRRLAVDRLTDRAIAELPTQGVQLWELLVGLGCPNMLNGIDPVLVDNVFEWRGGYRSTMTKAQIAAWLWLLAHEDWCSFFYDKQAHVERPSAENAPLLNEAQLADMERACEQLHELGWVERSRRADGRGWWYRADRHRADHLPRTWSAARWLLNQV